MAGRSVLSLVLFGSTLVPCASADVFVVDAGGTGDFTTIQAAIDAAQDGDLVLVEAGSYGPVQIVDKALHLAAVGREIVTTGKVEVFDLAKAKSVYLTGLRPNAGSGVLAYLTIDSCAGSVRVRDCDMGWNAVVAREGARVVQAEDVSFSACTFQGGENRRGVFASLSNVAFYDCRITGGAGSYECDGSGGPANPGGEALRATSCVVFFSSSDLEGGLGGDSCCPPNGWPGDGGDGLVLSASTAYRVDSSFLGGEGGYADGFCGAFGDSGQSIVLLGGSTLVPLPGPARTIDAPGILHVDDEAEWIVRGAPGDRVWLGRAGSGDWRILPALEGVFHLGLVPPAAIWFLGEIPGSGALHLTSSASMILGSTVDRTFHYQMLVVDAGGNHVLGEGTHLGAYARIISSICDEPIFVDAAAAPGGTGDSWQTAYSDLHVALDAADARRDECPASTIEVWVRSGTYRPAGAGGNRLNSFTVRGGIALLGGFEGDETHASERDPAAYPTILSGDLNGNDLPGFVNRGDNSARIVHVSASTTATVDGFVIRGGNANLSSPDDRGAGMGATAASLVVAGCRFEDNHANGGGGGLYVVSPGTIVERCVFLGNRANLGGGAIYSEKSMRANSCRFHGNQGGVGSAVYSFPVLPVDRQEITQCVFTGNHASVSGAIAFDGLTDYSLEVRDCTLADNLAEQGAAGIWSLDPGIARVSNTILWGNSTQGTIDETTQIDGTNQAGELDYCCVEGWTGNLGGTGNFGLDPLFVDRDGGDGVPGTEDDDVRLSAGSPCIDSGSNSLVPPDADDLDSDGDLVEPLPLDVGGLPRFVDDPAVIDSGEGTPPLVDVGAHERQRG